MQLNQDEQSDVHPAHKHSKNNNMKFKNTLIICVLILIIYYYLHKLLTLDFTKILPTPITCEGNIDHRIDELTLFSTQQGYPGSQATYISPEGHSVNCAIGWAKKTLLPIPMQFTHRLRYASLSKLLTTAVTLQIIAEKRLNLSDSVINLLELKGPFEDKRILNISIYNLLNHTSGFDRNISGDTMTSPNPWCPNNLNNLNAIQLDHAPGLYYSYSNVGYCLLGAIISRIDKLPLDSIFNIRLLEPTAAKNILPIPNKTILKDESNYYFDSKESLNDLLLIDYNSNLATGAWSGNSSELAKIIYKVYGHKSELLPQWLIKQSITASKTCDIRQWRTCHAFGFYQYQEDGQQSMYWRDGSLPGVTTFAAIFENGSVVVFIANSRHYNWKEANDLLGKKIYQLFK